MTNHVNNGSYQGEGNPIKVFDGTPPADFPEQVIISQDKEFVARNPQAAYYLRVKKNNCDVEVVQLPGAVGPAHARRMARDLGYEPTHYTEPGNSHPFLF